MAYIIADDDSHSPRAQSTPIGLMQISGNLFANLPPFSEKESAEVLVHSSGVRIERIVSHSAPSPEGFWYDQEDDEWVLIIRGTASLRFESGEIMDLKEGDHLLIPQRCRHRVDQTSSETIWLAVHISTHPQANKNTAT